MESARLLEWYENLTIKTLKDIGSFYDANIFFKDPFNEMRGLDKMIRLYQDMFDHLQRPKFVFIDVIEQNEQIFLTWDLTFIFKEKTYRIHGSSHLKLNHEMKIIYHRDYWDVGEELLLKIPVIKTIYGNFRKRLAVS